MWHLSCAFCLMRVFMAHSESRKGIARSTQKIPRTRNRSSYSRDLESQLSRSLSYRKVEPQSLLRWPLKALSGGLVVLFSFRFLYFCLAAAAAAAEFAGFVSRWLSALALDYFVFRFSLRDPKSLRAELRNNSATRRLGDLEARALGEWVLFQQIFPELYRALWRLEPSVFSERASALAASWLKADPIRSETPIHHLLRSDQWPPSLPPSDLLLVSQSVCTSA